VLPPIPYADVAGYTARTKVAPQDVAYVAATYPGYIEHRIARASSWINARLQKRYAVPLGQAAPQLVAAGTTPPAVTLKGRPQLGSLGIALAIVAAGALGAATFWWSADGGLTWTMGPLLAASGPTPPAVGVSGTSTLAKPSLLEVGITTGGALGTARFQWSQDGGNTWNIGGPMASSGTTPPAVTLSGTSNVALPSDIEIQITTAGALGTAIFEWSQDGGSTWTTGLQTSATAVPLGNTGLAATFALGNYATNNLYTGQGILTASSYVLGATGLTLVFPAGTYSTSDSYAGQGITTAATVTLGSTGLSALFPTGTYGADNTWSGSTPVPEIALGWLVALLDVDVWQRRGANPQDPTIASAILERDTALAEIKEAADSNEGLFELPTNDVVGDSAVVRATPLSYTEASPFVAADRQEREAYHEDRCGSGTYGGEPWDR
jgi:hypothetical protein